MFLLGVICLIASSAAMPTLDYPIPPELHTNLPNIETNEEHKVDPEAINSHPRDENSTEEEDEVHRIIVIPVPPSPPELPPFDESVFESLFKKENLEDFHDVSEDKPHVIKWKLPKIRFPGGYIIDDVYGPHISWTA